MRRSRFEQIEGQQFGRWKVLKRVGGRSARVVCECGARRLIELSSLRSGNSKSCGCLKRELATVHGQSGGARERTRTYKSWAAMMQRCFNKNQKHYAYYGGRGIRVCKAWRTFEGFFKDMGERPQGMTLDRIDRDRGYEPGNCRWANKRTQMINRVTTRLIKFDGQELPINAWARTERSKSLGLSPHVIRFRLDRGWPVAQALGTPVLRRRQHWAGKEPLGL